MRFPSRRTAALLVPVLLSACLFGGPDTPPRRPSARAPAAAVIPSERQTQACLADLSGAGATFNRLDDRDFGGGCVVAGAVQLTDIGVPVNGLKSIRCPTARAFVGWVRHGVGPAARQILGSDVVRIESYGTYACRGIVGGGSRASGRLSEHAYANAVDVGGFVLADGRRISVEGGWNGDDAAVREFLRIVHRSGCRRFATTLGPDYNAAHRNHFHFDMGRGPFCR